MSEQTPHARATEADRSGPPGMPRWVKIAGIVVLALVLLFLVLELTGVGGDHGPGRHLSREVGTLGEVSAAVPGGARA
jgi:hypothetical protein